MKQVMVAAALAVALFSTHIATAGAYQNTAKKLAVSKAQTKQRKNDKMEFRGQVKMQGGSKSSVAR